MEKNNRLMRLLWKIRLCAGIGLVCAFCMPLSQCSPGAVNGNQPDLMRYAMGVLGCYPDRSTIYAMGEVNVSWHGMLIVLGFTWPILTLLMGAKWLDSRYPWAARLGELCLCCVTVYVLVGLTLFEDWLIGAYVAAGSIATYGGTSLALVFRGARGWSRGFWLQRVRAGG